MTTFAAQTRAQVLASAIEKQIVEREFEPGELIGTIDSLKMRSGFARSTVAEAVRLLTDRGLAEIRPGRGGGLFATASTPVVRIRHTLLAVTDAPASVAEAVAVREALEVLIDGGAAPHRTAAPSAAARRGPRGGGAIGVLGVWGGNRGPGHITPSNGGQRPWNSPGAAPGGMSPSCSPRPAENVSPVNGMYWAAAAPT